MNLDDVLLVSSYLPSTTAISAAVNSYKSYTIRLFSGLFGLFNVVEVQNLDDVLLVSSYFPSTTAISAAIKSYKSYTIRLFSGLFGLFNVVEVLNLDDVLLVSSYFPSTTAISAAVNSYKSYTIPSISASHPLVSFPLFFPSSIFSTRFMNGCCASGVIFGMGIC